MRIGILETGRNRDTLVPRYGGYPDMFRVLLGEHASGISFETYAALDGVLPRSPGACDGWVVTGSKHTAFDRLPWMVRLEAFLRQVMTEGRPLVGICFGHQILAQAMGGTVERAPAGWGLGVHSYRVAHPNDWTGDRPAAITLSAVHRDQVTVVPDKARVLAHSEFCPAAILAYGDNAITFQGHPEFKPEFVRDLIGELERDGLPEQTAAQARATLDMSQGTDAGIVARWILNVLTGGRRNEGVEVSN